MATPVALDALGVSVAFSADPFGSPVYTSVRWRDAKPEEAAISPAGTVSTAAVAMDDYGNGVAAWTATYSGTPHIVVSQYSSLAPVVAQMRVQKRKFRYRSSEPAVVSITVRRKRGGHKASQTTIARPGLNSVKFTKRVRKLLRRKGRYVATIRTYDAGPRSATYKVKFRRR